MTPGAQTSPGERTEALDRRPTEATNHGEQVRHTRDFCEKLRKEPEYRDFQELIDGYRKRDITKNQLREAFKAKLKSAFAERGPKMGLASDSDTDIEAFLSRTQCFDNQLMSQIESDAHAKEKAHEDMVTNCLSVAHDEYGDFDESELKKALKKESFSRLKLFLENPKFRKTTLRKLPGSHALTEKALSDINFDEITREISKLDATNPKKREIQEAWLKISSIAGPDEDLASAFARVAEKGAGHTDLAGAYKAFFGNDNTLISSENREKILNFLTRQYIPLVPFGVLETIDPKTSKTLLISEEEKREFETHLPTDHELATALKKDKEEVWEKIYKRYIGGGDDIIGTANLPFETKVRLLSQFGSIAKAEEMLQYYRGQPGSLRSSMDTEEKYREKFKVAHNIDPEKLDTKTTLVEELAARLGHRVEGLEHFDAGCVMEWKTTGPEKEEITGYYVIDSVPSDDPDEDNILTVRFLGNNKDPLSPSGLARHYTGADFYHYLDGCAEDGRIIFRERGEFEEEIEKNTSDKKNPRYYTEQEAQAELRNQFPDTAEVQSMDSLNYEIDQILNPNNEHPRESKNPVERELYEGMIFTKISDNGIDTFQIQAIDEKAGTITLWDGWGKGKKSVQTKTFTEFVNILKLLKRTAKENGLYRLSTGKKPFGIKEFNQFCITPDQYEDGKEGGIFKKMRQVNIREIDGKNTFGKLDPKTGNFAAMPVIKVEGEKKDLYIESIDGSTVTYRRGTFKQGKYDKEKDKWTQNPEFSGSPSLTMSLTMLWAYLHENPRFDFDKPIEEAQKKEKKESGKLSWWNVLMHAHSIGVIIQGDLWKAPFKAWEEQHHKDHAFNGKLTAALAIEKLKNGSYGPISGILNYAEWPSLMVADGSSSIQSYLEELVNKIDGMSSTHRTNLIKKWGSKEHFPSPKFMAAMFASMQIFGQLYPYDDGKDDPRKGEWFWYNSINHSLGHKYPHMPPHDGEPWPAFMTDPEGNMMTEVQTCHKIFGSFKHPLLTNLGRRFQKYSGNGQEKLKAGGPNNLNERTTMEGKLDWMMNTVLGQKIPEAYGDATELWLKEGYPTAISTMPYAATLFGCREQQMLPHTQEAIKKEFQDNGVQVPMFVFMQNKNLGDVFRKTSLAFAYTIDKKCGDKLQELIDKSSQGRLTRDNREAWTKDFSAFWRKYGTELMHKLSGMRDPMLNLMINDPQTFDEMLEDQPEEKKKEYKNLRENRGAISAYYNRLSETYDSPSHVTLHREKGFYSGDQFRFRDSFEIGYPIAWVNWDAYIDANLDKGYAKGEAATDGDGVFNEIRGFLYKIPKMAEKMAEEMGFTSDPKKKKYVDKISKALYEKTVGHNQIGRLMKQKIDAKNPKAEYCSMTAMMFEIIPPQQLSVGGAPIGEQNRYKKYFEQIQSSLVKAKEIEQKDGFAEGIKYREKMANKWSEIVKKEIDTESLSIDQIYAGDYSGEKVSSVQKNTQTQSGRILREKLDKFDEMARKGKDVTSHGTQNSRVKSEPEDIALSA